MRRYASTVIGLDDGFSPNKLFYLDPRRQIQMTFESKYKKRLYKSFSLNMSDVKCLGLNMLASFVTENKYESETIQLLPFPRIKNAYNTYMFNKDESNDALKAVHSRKRNLY